MADCDEHESWTHRRAMEAHTALEKQGVHDLEAIHRWTRMVEVMATNMPNRSWAKYGIDAKRAREPELAIS